MIICFPHAPGHGDPGSFQTRFESALKALGWQVVYPNSGIQPDIVMVVGGTRRLVWLWKMKREGVPIIYRLGGNYAMFIFRTLYPAIIQIRG